MKSSILNQIFLPLLCAMIVITSEPAFAQNGDLPDFKSAISLHVPFDGGFDARVATGTDGHIYTGSTSERKEVRKGNHCSRVTIAKGAGKFGDALRFSDKGPETIFYHGSNMAYRPADWSGTVSFWLKLTPDEDLKPGYCDPIQITEKAWNDAALFVDFDKTLPRDFRLGVFADYRFWNPTDIAWEKLPVADRPMVVVQKPPFSRDQWTHVAFTYDGINKKDSEPATCTLYLNGKSTGELRKPMQFHWNSDNAAIMLGLEYIGDLDDLAVFSRALSAKEIQQLFALPKGLSGL